MQHNSNSVFLEIKAQEVIFLLLLFCIIFSGYALANEDKCVSSSDFLSGEDKILGSQGCDPFVSLQIEYLDDMKIEVFVKNRKNVLSFVKQFNPKRFWLFESVYNLIIKYKNDNFSHGITGARRVYSIVDGVESGSDSFRRDILYWRIAIEYEKWFLRSIDADSAAE